MKSKKPKRLKRQMRAARKRREEQQPIFGVSGEPTTLVDPGLEYLVLRRIYTYGYLTILAIGILSNIFSDRWLSRNSDPLVGLIYCSITFAFVYHAVKEPDSIWDKIKGFLLVTIGSLLGQYVYLRGMVGAPHYTYVHHSGDKAIKEDLYSSSDD